MIAGTPTSAPDSGTALLRTAEVRGPGGTRHRRRTPGPRAPHSFVPVQPDLHRRLAALRVTGDARLALPAEHGPARIYAVDGGESVAKVLLTSGPQDELVEPVRGFGRLLRALHAVPPPIALAGERAHGLDRLGDWLTGRHTDPHAAYAQAAMRRHLGTGRWVKVLDRYARLTTEDQDTLVHGAASLGSLIVNATPGTDSAGALPASGVLLTGEDLSVGHWHLDVGWAVGELVELRWQLGGDAAAWQALIDALFEGYGRDLGTDWPLLAALRILLHVHDIAAYVDWYTAGFDHYAGFVAFLIDL